MSKKQREYKDNIFRMLFKDKKNLLSLYNAVRGTDYSDPEALEINTLENVIYINMKNDLSFVIDDELNLYEHQSTANPNMPMRDLFYVSKILQNLTKDEDLYGSKQIMVPMPRFLVFYNGRNDMPEQWEMRLSNAFIQPKSRREITPMLELTVQAYSINYGRNQKLMESCKVLKEYAQYVSRVRSYAKKRPIKEAIERAVDECIEEGILRDFLRKNRAEAVEMSWYEFNEELHLKNERAYAYEQGIKDGQKNIEQEIKKARQEERQRVQEEFQRVKEENQRLQEEIARLKQLKA